MQPVGATDGFARRPFLWTGIWYGLGGGLLAARTRRRGVAALSGPIARLAALDGSGFRLEGLRLRTCGRRCSRRRCSDWLGSWVAATRHIRAIHPS